LIDLWNKRIGFTPGWTNVEAMHRGVVQMLRADENDFFGFQAAFEQDLHGLLLKIEQPTMILTNTGDDIYFAALRAKEIRPDFLFKELSGGTHDIVDEQPEAWAEIVTEFFFEKK
jgi:pimeloyl-ACP methyl ester carboxylesterase